MVSRGSLNYPRKPTGSITAVLTARLYCSPAYFESLRRCRAVVGHDGGDSVSHRLAYNFNYTHVSNSCDNVVLQNDENTYGFETPSRPACKHLYKCSMEHHSFFRLVQVSPNPPDVISTRFSRYEMLHDAYIRIRARKII